MRDKLLEYEASKDSDVIIYGGEIRRSGYEALSNQLDSSPPRHGNVCFALQTVGGEPDAAFRIARCLRHHYKRFILLVPEYCKSAGTLIAIGADELVVCDRGELGPLDVQVNKPDEIMESTSGLDIMQALSIMQTQAMESFRNYLLELKANTPITTKTAADMSAKLAIGLFAPVYNQIEPTRLGEMQRAISIALAYGERLNAYGKNLKRSALQKLVMGYPSHGFVIDRKEAGTLFNSVKHPCDFEKELSEYVRGGFRPSGEPVVFSNIAQYLDEEEINDVEEPTGTVNHGNGQDGVEGVQPAESGNGTTDITGG